MSTDTDFDRIVREWVEIGPTELSDRVMDAAREGVARTRQRRGWRGAWRRSVRMPAPAFAIAGGAVVLVIVSALMFGALGGKFAIGGPQQTSSPTFAASPSVKAATGVQLRFHVRSAASATPDAAAMSEIRDIVQRRLEAAGLSGAVVTLGDGDTVVVDLAPGGDGTQVRSIVERQGELTVVPLPPATYGTVSTGGPAGVADGQPLPSDASLTPLFSGAAITSANATTDQNASPAVQFDLDPAAARLFADYTTNHIGEFFAIVLDGTVLASPSINAPVTGGSAMITFGSTPGATAQVSELVAIMRSGPLPFPLDFAGSSASPAPSPSS